MRKSANVPVKAQLFPQIILWQIGFERLCYNTLHFRITHQNTYSTKPHFTDSFSLEEERKNN